MRYFQIQSSLQPTVHIRNLLPLFALVSSAILCSNHRADAVTLAGNITNWWTFDGGLGDPQAGSVTLATNGGPTQVAGVGGNSPFALGSSGNLAAGVEGSLDSPGDFTYSLWVRKTGSAQFRKLFQHTTGAGFAQVETDQSNGVIWNVRINGTNSETDTTSFLGDNNWHHLALWRQGNLVGVFVDGQVPGVDGFGQEQNLGTGQTLTGTTGFAIGAATNGGERFLGEIDDFRIYNVKLSQADAAAIYNGGVGDFIPEPSVAACAALGLLTLGLRRRRRVDL